MVKGWSIRGRSVLRCHSGQGCRSDSSNKGWRQHVNSNTRIDKPWICRHYIGRRILFSLKLELEPGFGQLSLQYKVCSIVDVLPGKRGCWLKIDLCFFGWGICSFFINIRNFNYFVFASSRFRFGFGFVFRWSGSIQCFTIKSQARTMCCFLFSSGQTHSSQ